MWPFKKKPQPPEDLRVWNEDWKKGDTAECIVDGVNLQWNCSVPPWHRPAYREQLTVTGFSEGVSGDGTRLAYYLHFKNSPFGIETRAFRKVRPVSQKEETSTSIKDKILKAKPGPDNPKTPEPLPLKEEWILPK